MTFLLNFTSLFAKKQGRMLQTKMLKWALTFLTRNTRDSMHSAKYTMRVHGLFVFYIHLQHVALAEP
uniref:Uncharacterized protein n=1 Tax=Arundo donax TaxID=35708 RepID=A0A0A9CR60_ARUDO